MAILKWWHRKRVVVNANTSTRLFVKRMQLCVRAVHVELVRHGLPTTRNVCRTGFGFIVSLYTVVCVVSSPPEQKNCTMHQSS